MRSAHSFFLEQADRCDPEVMLPYDIAHTLQDIFQEYLQLRRVKCGWCYGAGRYYTAGGRQVDCERCLGMGELIDD